MSSKLSGLLGLLILFAGGAGLYVLSRQTPGGEEESEPAIKTIVPVEVAQIRRQTLHDYLWVYGSVIPNPGTAGAAPAGAGIRASGRHCHGGSLYRGAAGDQGPGSVRP